MKEIIQRLKKDISEQSGASPSFLQDLQEYMSSVESFSEKVKNFGKAFPNACYRVTGNELAELANEFNARNFNLRLN